MVIKRTIILSLEVEEEEKKRIVVELVLGMRYIHKIIHRNLKTKNILLSKNKRVRITYFVLANEEDLEISQTKRVGTLLFMAPELFEYESKEVNLQIWDYRWSRKISFNCRSLLS